MNQISETKPKGEVSIFLPVLTLVKASKLLPSGRASYLPTRIIHSRTSQFKAYNSRNKTQIYFGTIFITPQGAPSGR